MRVIRLSQPSVEPVTLAEAKLHLRVEADDEDTLIASYIVAARQRVEDYCNRAFVSAGFAALYSGSLPLSDAATHVPIAGVTSLESVQYRDGDGVVQTLGATGFTLDAERLELRPSDAWPSGTDLRVEVLAGDDSTPPVIPGPIRSAILLYVADLYELRQAHVIGAAIAHNPAAEMLMQPYRVRMGL